jgi:hypothetical protein
MFPMKKFSLYAALPLTVLLSGCIVPQPRQQVDVPQQVQPGPPQQVQAVTPLGLEEVKSLAKAGLGDDLIISQIRSSATVYHLGTADIIALKTAGISEKVIDYMINTPSTAVPPPSAGVQQTVVVEPAPACVVAPVVYPYWGWGWYGGYYWGPRRYWR